LRNFVEKQMALAVWSCLWIFWCVPMVCVSFGASTILLMLLWLCDVLWGQVLWYLKRRSSCSGSVGCLGSFIPMWIAGLISISGNTAWHCDFNKDYTESAAWFWHVAFFTLLSLPIHEHGCSFYFLVSSLISCLTAL
jgi:hypothetical protein